jgi:large subunit ribosomal protein L28
MSRACELTGETLQFGNNVSHSNRKTRRVFLTNVRVVKLKSDKLNQEFSLKIKSKTLKTVFFKGGLDLFLLNTKNSKLTEKAVKIKKQILKMMPAGETA